MTIKFESNRNIFVQDATLTAEPKSKLPPVYFGYSDEDKQLPMTVADDLTYPGLKDVVKCEWNLTESDLLGLAATLLGLTPFLALKSLSSGSDGSEFTSFMELKHGGVGSTYTGDVYIQLCLVAQEHVHTIIHDFPSENEMTRIKKSHIKTMKVSSNDKALLLIFAVHRIAQQWSMSVDDVLTMLRAAHA